MSPSARLNSPQVNTSEPPAHASREAADIHHGIVKSFGAVVDGKKTSYGWITDDRTGKDVFVHFTGILRKNDEFRHLKSGQRVQFRVVMDGSRQKAVDVEVIG